MTIMEAKHTPEPWKVVEHHGAIDVMGAGSGVCRVFTDPNQDSLPTMPQARANARLIAAAPDLLAALREIVGQDRPNRWGYDAAEVAMDDGWRERARAAMRAATGGSGAASDVACASARATGGGK